MTMAARKNKETFGSTRKIQLKISSVFGMQLMELLCKKEKKFGRR